MTQEELMAIKYLRNDLTELFIDFLGMELEDFEYSSLEEFLKEVKVISKESDLNLKTYFLQEIGEVNNEWDKKEITYKEYEEKLFAIDAVLKYILK